MFAKYYACDPLTIGLIKQTDQVTMMRNFDQNLTEFDLNV